ncbi:kelch-like protein 10 [Notothenia coriiceps]|uniref:Kelch-like protein 10 n=1 Tax=Notothenia coriiceps TaxID=8208 RepID=A0A6I9PBA1_9TELE|nr:PREDICTED: kelch-like protein 10 [Notothenia coriiceps]
MSSSVFNDLRQEGDFCDAVIRVKDVEFQIHKVILCKCSKYFLAFFRRWSSPGQQVFNIGGLSADMMALIIEFAYTGSVHVTGDNVEELLLAADQLDVPGIVQNCCDFMEEQLSVKNCIGIHRFTKTINCSRLQHKAFSYVLGHFEEVVFSQEFQQLSVENIIDIIGRDELNVKEESTVFEAIILWIAYSPEERKGHFATLLSKVRLALMSEGYLKSNVRSNELVKNNIECKLMVRKALDIITCIRPNYSSVLCNHLARPRLPNAVLLAIGGWSGGDPTNGIEAYDIRTDSWVNVSNGHERPRAYHGTAFLNGDIYCVGGFDRVEHFNSVRRYDPNTHTWHEVASMYYRRCYVSVTVLNGCIYAMGGYDGHTRLSTAERYMPETNQWSLIAPMSEQRSDASCTTLHDKVYICGGFNGNECLQTAESYCPETNQWTAIALMNCRRSGVGIIAHADHIFAVGGFDGTTRLRSAEAYDPRRNTWHELSSMLSPRSNFGIEVLEGRIFVVGGFNGFNTSYDVEYYNSITDEWCKACDMEIFRSALSCCVVSGLPNMAEYALPRDALPLLHVDGESVEVSESDESV